MEESKFESIRRWVEDINKASCSESRLSSAQQPRFATVMDALPKYTLRHSATADQKANLDIGSSVMSTRKRERSETKGEAPAEETATTGHTTATHQQISTHTFSSFSTHCQRRILEWATPSIRFEPFGQCGKPDAVARLFNFLLSEIDTEPSDALKQYLWFRISGTRFALCD